MRINLLIKWILSVLSLLLLGYGVGHYLDREQISPERLKAPIEANYDRLIQTSLDRYVDWARNSAQRTKAESLENTRFTGWEAYALLDTLNTAFRVTGDTRYLEDFAFFFRDFLSYRADIAALKNYEGNTPPQWYRAPKYDIFNYSPHFKYRREDQRRLMNERGWKSFQFSDVNHDGLFLLPMLDFAALSEVQDLLPGISEEIVEIAVQTVESHEREWVQLDDGTGYYTFPKNAPVYVDGVEMPINEAAVFGAALVALHELTGEDKYLVRASSMINRWLAYVSYAHDGTVRYPYWTGHQYDGWDADDEVSVNTPYSSPAKKVEPFRKAWLTATFVARIRRHNEDDGLVRFHEGLRQTWSAIGRIESNQISFFPYDLSFALPKDSYHTFIQASFPGFLAIGDGEEEPWKLAFLQSYVAAVSAPDKIGNFLRVLDNRPKAVERLPHIRVTTATVSPRLPEGDSETSSCPLKVSGSTVAVIEFRHTTPKHNRLFLVPKGFSGRGIRLEPDGSLFKGIAHLREGDCVSWSWGTKGRKEYRQPATPEENQLTLHLYSLEHE